MASIDKTSVRHEVSRLKMDFEQLCAEGKVAYEIKVLMSSMFMVIELMLSIFLERATQKNGQNSSKPSSQTEKDESALSHPGSKGKGKSENDNAANNTRIQETVRISKVRVCNVCGEDLNNTPALNMKDERL